MKLEMKRALGSLTVVAGAVAMLAPVPSLAVLQRAGPVSAETFGYPAWYQDRNGVALELCTINSTDALANDLLINSGQCAIVNAPPPNGIQVGPENLQTLNFAGEHFYTLASGAMNPAGMKVPGGPIASGAGRIIVNMGVEGSFTTPAVVDGQQITFSRWRIQHTSVACTGNYTYYTPTNTPQTFPAVAGGRVFQTIDEGLTNPADVLTGHTGPFLFASNTAGGVPSAPYIGPDGKKYLYDVGTGLLTAITGSVVPNALLNDPRPAAAGIRQLPFTDYIAVSGPGVESGDCTQLNELVVAEAGFSLFGRFFNGVIPSRHGVDRATYRVADANNDGVPDSFQIGTWASATQEAGKVEPQMASRLWFSDSANPASSTAELAMARQGVTGGVAPPPGILPTSEFRFFSGNTAATQINAAGTTLASPVYSSDRVRLLTDTTAVPQDVALVDEMRVVSATWNPNNNNLVVVAESGAFLQAATNGATCSIPCLTVDSFGLPPLTAGVATDFRLATTANAKSAVATKTFTGVVAPPATILVKSSAGGQAVGKVKTMTPGGYSVNADNLTVAAGGSAILDVLANDVGVAAVPALQTCIDGTTGNCGIPNPAAACTGTVTVNCTAQGGRLSVINNRVQYAAPAGKSNIVDSFWYQTSTLSGTNVRALVTVNVTTANAAPIANNDTALIGVQNHPLTIDVLANDTAGSGVNVNSIVVTKEPCNLDTLACANGSASTTAAPGKLVFTPNAPGNWNMNYQFSDNNGAPSSQALVAVNVLAQEIISITTQPVLDGTSKVNARGTINTGAGMTVEMRVPPAGVVDGCANPLAGTIIGKDNKTSANSVWNITSTATFAAVPANLYFYEQVNGGCVKAN